MENPKTINVSFHSCPLEFHKAKGAFKACDLCETDFEIGEMKYRCRQHTFDLCLKCYSKHVNKDPNLDANERARLQQMVDDPKARQVLIDSLKEATTQDMSQEQAAAYDIVVGILQKKDVTAGNLASAVAKLAVAEAKGQVMDKVKEEISSQVAEELGLSSFDPTGLLSAVKLIRAIGKGDLDAIAQNVAVIIGAKLLLAVVCTIM